MKKIAWLLCLGVGLSLTACQGKVKLPSNMDCYNNADYCASGICDGACRGRDIGAACEYDAQCATENCQGTCQNPVCEQYCKQLANGTPASNANQCYSGRLLNGRCAGKVVGASCADDYQCETAFCDDATFLCSTNASGRKMAGSACTSASECYAEGLLGAAACTGTSPNKYCVGIPGGQKFMVRGTAAHAYMCQSAAFFPIPGEEGYVCAFPKVGCTTCTPQNQTCSPACLPGQTCNTSGTPRCEEQTGLPTGAACHIGSNCLSGECLYEVCQPNSSPSFDFTVVPAVPSLDVVQGNTASVLVETFTVSGSPQMLTVGTPTIVPTGPTVSVSSSTLTSGGTFLLNISVPSGATVRTYNITVTLTGGGLSRAMSFNLNVVAPAPGDFTIGAPASVTIAQGGSGTASVSVTATSGTPTVSFSASYATSLATGVSAGFSPATITGTGSSTLTLNVASTVPAGTYTGAITITGTAPTNTHATTMTLVVTAQATNNKVHPATCGGPSECRSGACVSGVCAPDQFRLCNLYAGTVVEVFGVNGEFRTETISGGDGCWRSDPSRNDASAVEVGTLNYLCRQYTYWWTTSDHQCTLVGSTGKYGVIWSNGKP